MSPRLNAFATAPEALNKIIELEKYIAKCYTSRNTLSYSLVELIKIRVSQINGCAYCIDMHTKDARAKGETEQRIYCLSTWKESPFYSAKEKVALEWAEANTLIHQNDIDDELYLKLKKEFNNQELLDLTFVVTTINIWNRLAISFKNEIGSYQPGDFNFQE